MVALDAEVAQMLATTREGRILTSLPRREQIPAATIRGGSRLGEIKSIMGRYDAV